MARSTIYRRETDAATNTLRVAVARSPVRVRIDAGRGLKRLALWFGAATLLAESSIAYRLWAQLSGTDPSLPALALVYGLGGRLVDPFRGLDTVHSSPSGPGLEFPALVALEGYLVGGVLLVGLLLALAAAARWARVPVLEFDLQPLSPSAAARRAFVQCRRAAARGCSLAANAAADLRNRDWRAYRSAVAWARGSAARIERDAHDAASAASAALTAARPFVLAWIDELRAVVHVTGLVAAAGAATAGDIGADVAVRTRDASLSAFEGVRALWAASRVSAAAYGETAAAWCGARSRAGLTGLQAGLRQESALLMAGAARCAGQTRAATASLLASARHQTALAVEAFQAFENGANGGGAASGPRLTRRQFLHRVRVDG